MTNMAVSDLHLQENLARAAQVIATSRHLVALTGAGISVESGIPPYRGAGGLWANNGQPTMLSYKEFVQDPGVWWRRRLAAEADPASSLQEMKQAADQAAPNAGHYALVEMEHAGLLKATLTQNVDNLHRSAGSREVVEIHGNRNWLRCIGCGHRRKRDGVVLDRLPPTCPRCSGVVKIDTVMFGEPIPEKVLEECKKQTRLCDCMLLVGTSGMVKPAASLPLVAREQGATLIEINPEETALTPWCHLVLRGTSGQVLPMLNEIINEVRS